jgi:hypothetical protein
VESRLWEGLQKAAGAAPQQGMQGRVPGLQGSRRVEAC